MTRLTVQPVVIGSGGDLLHFLLGFHWGPAAVFFELDLITLCAAVEDLHKKPVNTRTCHAPDHLKCRHRDVQLL